MLTLPSLTLLQLLGVGDMMKDEFSTADGTGRGSTLAVTSGGRCGAMDDTLQATTKTHY